MSYEKSMVFRRVNTDDADQLYKLLNDRGGGNRFFHPHRFNMKTLQEICRSKKDYYYVLVLNEKIIGYSMLRLFGTDTPSFGCYINRRYRGDGYGTLITQWTLDEAYRMGYKEVILHVHRENYVAIGLYQKAGFMYADEEIRMVHR